jgi:hypothetical protein
MLAPPSLHRFQIPWVTGGIIILVLLVFVIYSVIFKTWCLQYERAWGGTWGGDKIFSADRGKCIREKSLFDF